MKSISLIIAAVLGLLGIFVAIALAGNQAGARVFILLLGIGIIGISITDLRSGILAFKGKDNIPVSKSRTPIFFWTLLSFDFIIGFGLSFFAVSHWITSPK